MNYLKGNIDFTPKLMKKSLKNTFQSLSAIEIHYIISAEESAFRLPPPAYVGAPRINT